MKRIAAAALATATLVAVPARAEQVCGWYVIAFCARSQAAAQDFASRGWGAVIDTNQYPGLKPGLRCVVSGPQTKAGALRDRRAARANGVSQDAYIKRACTDLNNVGD